MKNYSWKYDEQKRKEKLSNKEQKAGGFRCTHCKQFVLINEFMGTMHRNHCPYCLWSKHVDLIKPGDRKATCHTGMRPIGLTFKDEGFDKYGKRRQGEVKLVHLCTVDMAVSTNRIAADDETTELLSLLSQTTISNQYLEILKRHEITLLTENDSKEVRRQLFGE